MKTRKEAVNLLEKYAPDEEAFQKVYQHALAVEKAAMSIAGEIAGNGYKVDKEFLSVICLVHDVGRFEHPPGEESVKHGLVGGKILRKEGWDEKYALAVERHLGAGISKEDIIRDDLPLPKKDFVPETVEEKILAYADNVVFGDRIAKVSEVVERFRKEIPQSVERLIGLHNEIEKMRGGSYFI